MTDRRVGNVDHPRHFGAVRSLAVYQNARGTLFLKRGGQREKLHNSTRWTARGGMPMRGAAPLRTVAIHADNASSDSDSGSDSGSDDEDLAQAIAASLAELAAEPPPVANPPAAAPPAANPPAAAPPPQPAPPTHASPPTGATCAICLSAPATMLMRPCSHLCACERCVGRLARQPCVICRAPVRSTLRVFF